MKFLITFRNLFLLALVITAASCTPEDGVDGMDGITGEQGAAGQDGNANVASYEFSIDRNEWGANLHYGSGNVYRAFDVNSLFVETDVISAYWDGDVILTYVRPQGAGYGELKPTPFMAQFQRPDATTYGVRIEYAPSRGELNIARTTNGYDYNGIDLADVPETLEVRFVIIEASAFIGRSQAQSFERMCEANGVDITDYEAVLEFANSL